MKKELEFGDLTKKGIARKNYTKQERRHPYVSMTWNEVRLEGVLSEKKQQMFRKICLNEPGMSLAKTPHDREANISRP